MRSIGDDWSPETLMAMVTAHDAEVRATLPPERLLVFSATERWEPLYAFLGQPVPDNIPFPRPNHRDKFFANIDDI